MKPSLAIAALLSLCGLMLAGCVSTKSKAIRATVGDATDERLLGQDELFTLEAAAAVLDYPLTFGEAFEKLKGKERLRWSYGADSSHRERRQSKQVFDVITPHLKDKGYVVVFEGTDIEDGTSVVTRVAIGYHAPLGSIYFADLRDVTWVLRDSQKEPNKMPEPMSGQSPDMAHR